MADTCMRLHCSRSFNIIEAETMSKRRVKTKARIVSRDLNNSY